MTDDEVYYLRRATEEWAAVAAAANIDVKIVHTEFARRYLAAARLAGKIAPLRLAKANPRSADYYLSIGQTAGSVRTSRARKGGTAAGG